MNRSYGNSGGRKTLHVGLLLLPIAAWAFTVSFQSSSTKDRPNSNAIGWGVGWVNGRVVHDGRPVEGVRVGLLGDPVKSAVTARDGSFSLVQVPEGNQIVSTSLTGSMARAFTDSRLLVSVRRSGRTSGVELRLIEGGVIAGRVLDPAGVPIKHSRVRMYQIDEHGNAFGGFASVGSDGSFLSRLAPGDWLVEELPKIGDPNANLKVLAWDKVQLAEGDYKKIELRRIGQLVASHI